MENWELKIGDPGSFSIASDIRCGHTNYTNDHIWELKLEGGEPPALGIQTTFGLRARNFRIFPRFVEGDTAILDPNSFSKKPSVNTFYPNYLKVKFSPFIGVDVISEYWVPSSNVLSGRLSVTNTRLTQRKINIQLVGLLSPSEGGDRIALETEGTSNILLGHTDGIFPTIYMTGFLEGRPGPYPALSVNLDLAPGGIRQIIWVQAALESPESSFEMVQKVANVNWESEISRLDVSNNSLVDISTGDRDWDAAFKFTQKSSLGLFVGPTEHLPNPSFVYSRQPDHGYSSIGDGSDFNHLWDGQTPIEADYLSTLLLPATPDLVIGCFENFLATQTKSGYIDFKSGLANQRSNILATPILTNIAWRIYQTTEDLSFLKKVFPQLLSFIQGWFFTQQDRDGDGLPEWTHPIQSGFEDHPLFSQFRSWSLGGDISKIESPSLCAFLYNEISILIKMARIIEQTSPISTLEAIAENLKNAVEASWDDTENIYRNWDRESHSSPVGEQFGSLIGPGNLQIDRDLKEPVRITIQLIHHKEHKGKINVFIHGIGESGNHLIERVEAEQFHWNFEQGKGVANSEQIYASIGHIEVEGIGNQDEISVKIMDISGMDQTLLLPLWAGIPGENRASDLIHKTIRNPDKFWKSFGIPACIQESILEDHPCWNIHMIWNNLIGEGLLRYGHRDAAAELITKLMNAVVKNLKTYQSFYNFYHSKTGLGIGERNMLGGLAPVRLFMETLGVRIISTSKVLLSGKNPFPWPVTIRYRGLLINRELKNTKITFPGGQSAIVKSKETRIVTLEKS